jgi:hypothetical protein
MRYFILVCAVALILYPLYALFKCVQNIGTLTEYGYGVLVGGLLLLGAGIGLLVWSVKLIKKRNNHEA